MTKIKLKPQALGEIIFDLAYLIFAILTGIFFFTQGKDNKTVILYGLLAVILGIGDAFHLLPRVYCLYTDTMELHHKALGLGKMVTSISMTIFYIILYEIWQQLYHTRLPRWLTILVFSLAILRIILCISPQNGWFLKEPPLRFAIYRNLPFLLLGTVVAILYGASAIKGYQDGFQLMTPAIILSFAFYIIVVLFAGKNKKLGMFMLPKTCMYIWIISMGFHLL